MNLCAGGIQLPHFTLGFDRLFEFACRLRLRAGAGPPGERGRGLDYHYVKPVDVEQLLALLAGLKRPG
jgi:hypothetical protein